MIIAAIGVWEKEEKEMGDDWESVAGTGIEKK
jgi:hypothetical protein